MMTAFTILSLLTGVVSEKMLSVQPVLGGYFSIFVLARPPGAMVPESSIVLHFLPALAPPTHEREFRARFLMIRSHKSSMF